MSKDISNSETVKKVENNDNISFFKKNKKILIIMIFILLVVLLVFFFNRKTDEISKVKKLLNSNYYNISCIDKYCDEIVAYKGDPNGKTYIDLLKSDGTEVADFKIKNIAEAKTIPEPVTLGKNWFISKNVNNETKKIDSYSLMNKNGKT